MLWNYMSPRQAVAAHALESYLGIPDRETRQKLMCEYAGCAEDEDAMSMGTTSLSRLLTRCGVSWQDVGMLGVGSESLLDRSKSLKTGLMASFEARGDCAVEGTDFYHAYEGGILALRRCIDWSQSASWDGRWAVAICADVADGLGDDVCTGAAAAAVLVGPMAPLVLEMEHASCEVTTGVCSGRWVWIYDLLRRRFAAILSRHQLMNGTP